MKYYIGVDIGGMSIKAGVVDETGKILSKKTCVTRVSDTPNPIVEDIYNLCLDVISLAKLEKKDILGVGIGTPGTVNSKIGVITFAANLNFKKVNICKLFKKYWNIPVCVNNDANCAALGEVKFGSNKNIQNAVFVTLGTGVGTGFIIDGKIFEGVNGAGAEGGHICIRMNGVKCSCGQRGCWEAYASATALIRETKEAMEKHPESLMNKMVNEGAKIDGRLAFEARKQGDKVATAVVRNYVKYIGVGIVNYVNVFRPEIVLIGGGVSNEGEYFIKLIEKYVALHSFGKKVNKIPIIAKAELGNDAGLVGAAAPLMD